MEYVQFGKTGFSASRIGFGGAVAGLKNYLHAYDPADGAERAKVVEAVRAAVAAGINYFDTAPGYGNGLSESIFGEALADKERSSLFICTKVNQGERGSARRSLEASLERLRTPYVDLLQLHGTSWETGTAEILLAPGGMVGELEELKAEGLVRNIGFTSEDNNPAVYRFIESGRFDAMQVCYNLLFQHPYEPSRPFGSFYEAEKVGMGIATMRAPTSGTFQRWIRMVRPDDLFDYNRALIQFVLSNPLVDVALIGMRSAERVRQNVEICEDLSGRIDLDTLHERYV
jgi:hypothetical protein